MFSDVEFRLRSRVKTDSPEAMLFKYLNSRNTLYPAKDMVIIAISSYWLPLAYQAEEQPVDLEPHIRACLYRLQLHSSDGTAGRNPVSGSHDDCSRQKFTFITFPSIQDSRNRTIQDSPNRTKTVKS
jgi:hypothetical protein